MKNLIEPVKKYLPFILMGVGVLLIILGLVITPHSSKVVCKRSEKNDDGYLKESTVEVTLKSNKVTKIQLINVEEMDSSDVELSLTARESVADEFNDIEGIHLQYSKVNDNKIKADMIIDYEKINFTQAKDKLSYDESDGDTFYSREYTYDEMKNSLLDGYTCDK